MLNKQARKIVLDEFKRVGASNIGRHVYVNLDEFIIEMIVKDFKYSFGHMRYLVAPISNGTGQKWMQNVTFID